MYPEIVKAYSKCIITPKVFVLWSNWICREKEINADHSLLICFFINKITLKNDLGYNAKQLI